MRFVQVDLDGTVFSVRLLDERPRALSGAVGLAAVEQSSRAHYLERQPHSHAGAHAATRGRSRGAGQLRVSRPRHVCATATRNRDLL